MAKVTVDGIEVEVPNGASVLQACEAAGKEIPRFCYHERLSVAGNCRMCLVEVERAPKPVASCAYPVADGMKVFTDTPVVRNARRGVMEFLLINHPLDCPICDQGGECDLQDQAYAYGHDTSRYGEPKRAVKDKDIGPLIKTVMTRCIQCTRCVRFAAEVAGTPELGGTNRGENMEIGTYVEKALTSELSGNLIDICPVGALTSRPYAFVSRPWELTKTDSIDVLDAVGANIRVDARGPEVLRIIPRINEAVNEEWMADRGRFSFDGLKRRRLDRPWVRKDGKLVAATWPEAFAAIATRLAALPPERIGAIAGALADAESTLVLKELMAAYGSNNLDCRDDFAAIDAGRPDFWRFNTTIAGIEEADALLIIGSDVRREAPVLNARIRKRWTAGKFPVGFVGPRGVDLTYPARHMGEGPAAMRAFSETLKAAQKPMIILGRGALRRPDGPAVLAAAWSLAADVGALKPDWHGFNLLHLFGGQVGALELGFVSGKPLAEMLAGGVGALWLLNADGFDPARIAADTFVIYQGHHGDAMASRADVILPGAAYTEKDATWVNTEGRAQRGHRAIFPPGEAKEDWRIIRAFSEGVGKALPYDDIGAIRARLAEVSPVFARVGEVARTGCADITGPAAGGEVSDAPFVLPIPVYHQADVISRASEVMATCAAVYGPQPALAAE
ncbi:NADH-quinone oxidoreductase subunit G [Roseomonas alkaliterrae]|uniref:NADH-quinone oxidoreductase n=1 Tax=Neoroseomonas alkaliterrae TaxID=1452450 RepID=A0A840YAZ3_9PROT|nr:NADH-quinone oxidoreductase subunit NuoG [Neoroseomonas alkaliterrae]MBB5691044.1 NADH-quinone oxidoreductase subunit G [Neoroseomonas alkaliterrae]MBR0674719.1 NADH-quinone oxidoreductase subunit G [Neoroseomonas alkaliterrae]